MYQVDDLSAVDKPVVDISVDDVSVEYLSARCAQYYPVILLDLFNACIKHSST